LLGIEPSGLARGNAENSASNSSIRDKTPLKTLCYVQALNAWGAVARWLPSDFRYLRNEIATFLESLPKVSDITNISWETKCHPDDCDW